MDTIDTSTITSKYQTVIPRRIRQLLGVKRNEQLTWQIIRNHIHPLVAVMPKPKRWSEHLTGLGARVWDGIDTDQYLQTLKREWRK